MLTSTSACFAVDNLYQYLVVLALVRLEILVLVSSSTRTEESIFVSSCCHRPHALIVHVLVFVLILTKIHVGPCPHEDISPGVK